MTDLTELRAFADLHRELADKADALILALEAASEPDIDTPAPAERPPSDIRVGDTVRYVGTESPSLIGATGVISRIEGNNWATAKSGPLILGAYTRNLVRV